MTNDQTAVSLPESKALTWMEGQWFHLIGHQILLFKDAS